MRGRAVAVGTLVVLAAIVTGGAVAATESGDDSPAATATPTPEPTANDSDGNASFGAEVSAFMQSEAAKAEQEVDQGMWEAEFERGPAAALVEQRATSITDWVEQLRQRRAALEAAHENGTISDVRYRAELAAIDGALQGLERAVNRTEPAAESVGADAAPFEEIRERIRDARNRSAEAGDPPADRPGGNTTRDVGNGSNADNAQGNASTSRSNETRGGGNGSSTPTDDGRTDARSDAPADDVAVATERESGT